MTRRLLLSLPLALRLHADSAGDAWDTIATMASALSEGNAAAFLKAFDPAMPRFAELQAGVKALLDSAEVQSSIDPLRNEGDDQARTVELDWFLQIVQREDTGGVTRRRERIKCRLERAGKRWRVASLDAIAFFAAPELPARR